MEKKYFQLLDCEKAEEFCDKAEYRESGMAGKFRLKLHLLFCESCRKYRARNKRLSLLLHKASINTCTKEEKRSFQLQLDRERSKDLH